LAGDIIVVGGGHSGTVNGVPTLAGFNNLYVTQFTGFSQNSFGSWYKTAVGGETSSTIQFNASGTDGKLGVAMVFRNASIVTFNSFDQDQGSFVIRPLGTHNESDSTSMSVLIGWLNRQGVGNDATIVTEPVDYSIGARMDGASIGGSTSDWILTGWHRTYANRGSQSPNYEIALSDGHDHISSNSSLIL
jgi:hypothetical protein